MLKQKPIKAFWLSMFKWLILSTWLSLFLLMHFRF
jgi:hypothetical protein